MRRFGLILCVVLLLCQVLLFPVSAETAADTDKTDYTPDLSAAANASDEKYPYTEYLADTQSTELATADIQVEAVDALKVSAGVTAKKDYLLLDSAEEVTASWKVEVAKDGWYTLSFTYMAVETSSSSDIELGFLLDGAYPYYEAERFTLPRLWADDGEVRESNGNQFAPEQKQLFEKQTRPLRDSNGFVSEDLQIYLTAGAHTLGVISYGEAFRLYGLQLGVPETVLSFDEQMAKWKDEGIQNFSGEEFILEAEKTSYKNDRSVIGKSDSSNPGVKPSNAYKQMINYIGGSNWSMPDEYITWTVKAPSAGLYKLGFHFRQNYVINATSYRDLKVNGVHQYAEMASLAFDYENGWQFSDTVLGGRELVIYLNEGKNELTMSVTLGDMNEFSAKMEDVVLRLGKMYLDIVAIVGESPDSRRDNALFPRVPDLQERMESEVALMKQLIEERRDESGDIDDIAALLQKMNVVIEKMLDKQYEAQNYKSLFYDNYASLSAQLQEMKNMALDIDVLVFTAPGRECERTTSGFFESLGFEAQRFAASFMLDYNNASATQQGQENLTIWVNWSRDQTLVLNSLVTSKFTPSTNIGVTVRMTNASLLQGIMSGNGPDCSLSDSRTTPVNLAMRGALVDLSQYEDYDEVMEWFVEGAGEPYRYGDGIYALPATQQFNMLFYRTDIFEQYGIVDENGEAAPPKTWDEFLEIASVFMLNNMQVGLPYTELKDIYQVNGGVASLNIFPTLLMQNGLSIYNEDMTGTSFNDVGTMREFEEWTDYYTKYNLPKEYSFFARFRVGQIPMAVQPYAQYATLAAAAPEIKGRWEMAEIPGVLQEDGTINNSQAGFGSACMILKLSEHKDAAWELLKWWMSEETQHSYALDIEAILGVAGRYTSAIVAASRNLDWGKHARQMLDIQWNKVNDIREIPGGYYVSRAIDQAFWNVLSMNANPKDMMKKWGEVADAEITSKINQYKDTKGGTDE